MGNRSGKDHPPGNPARGRICPPRAGGLPVPFPRTRNASTAADTFFPGEGRAASRKRKARGDSGCAPFLLTGRKGPKRVVDPRRDHHPLAGHTGKHLRSRRGHARKKTTRRASRASLFSAPFSLRRSVGAVFPASALRASTVWKANTRPGECFPGPHPWQPLPTSSSAPRSPGGSRLSEGTFRLFDESGKRPVGPSRCQAPPIRKGREPRGPPVRAGDLHRPPSPWSGHPSRSRAVRGRKKTAKEDVHPPARPARFFQGTGVIGEEEVLHESGQPPGTRSGPSPEVVFVPSPPGENRIPETVPIASSMHRASSTTGTRLPVVRVESGIVQEEGAVPRDLECGRQSPSRERNPRRSRPADRKPSAISRKNPAIRSLMNSALPVALPWRDKRREVPFELFRVRVRRKDNPGPPQKPFGFSCAVHAALFPSRESILEGGGKGDIRGPVHLLHPEGVSQRAQPRQAGDRRGPLDEVGSRRGGGEKVLEEARNSDQNSASRPEITRASSSRTPVLPRGAPIPPAAQGTETGARRVPRCGSTGKCVSVAAANAFAHGARKCRERKGEGRTERAGRIPLLRGYVLHPVCPGKPHPSHGRRRPVTSPVCPRPAVLPPETRKTEGGGKSHRPRPVAYRLLGHCIGGAVDRSRPVGRDEKRSSPVIGRNGCSIPGGRSPPTRIPSRKRRPWLTFISWNRFPGLHAKPSTLPHTLRRFPGNRPPGYANGAHPLLVQAPATRSGILPGIPFQTISRA